MFRLKEKDETIAKLQADLCEKNEECKKLKAVVENQKQKNNVSIKIIIIIIKFIYTAQIQLYSFQMRLTIKKQYITLYSQKLHE